MIRAFIWRQSEFLKLLLLGFVLSLRKMWFSSELWLEYRDDKMWVQLGFSLNTAAGMQSPTAPVLGIPTFPRAEHRAPTRALPGSQSWSLFHNATEATRTRKRHETMRQ